MGPLVIMVVLVCGFWYTENHYQSRIRHARTNGWTSYFSVAMHGCKFVVQGFFTVLALYALLFFISLIISIPHLFWADVYEYKNLYWWLTDKNVMSYPWSFVLSLGLACLFAFAAGNNAKQKMQDEKERLLAYREMAAMDGIEALLVQAIDEGKLIFVTLKSRKVYIGYVAAPRIEHSHTQHLALIPYISGYRDKDTLRYHEQHRYYELYLDKNITADSDPLNLQHFRHVVPMDQVEAISLFDTSTYKSFDAFSVKEDPLP
ncbi:hypothetical protein M2403_004534 [Rahnella sp. BIGb0603]|uniref:hypothetical protein n=1 Tax=Rahnella sp. BIGb0603 TaxID=2940612 RepID=UPI0021680D08|nr:hypothetical protein [Rahnella sp. BIGb0603]MCS3425901.1 hypothetical protein [Rahnella sp. BIGb0603]